MSNTLYGKINSLGGVEYSWTPGWPPSGQGWLYLGNSDEREKAEKALQVLFDESERLLAQKEA